VNRCPLQAGEQYLANILNWVAHLKRGTRSCAVLPTIGRAANVAQMMEKRAMSDEYARGRRDGLRLALSILEAEEAKWEALLGESPSWRTNATRAIRHKAYQVARKRVQTALNRLLPKSESALPVEVASMIDQAGL
jgi:hypothetical protein